MIDFKIQKLIWDSTFFGYEIGKIEIPVDSDLEKVKNLIEKSQFKMIQIFSKKDLRYFLNLEHIDMKLTYSKKPSSNNRFTDIDIRSVSEDLSGNLAKLAKQAGEFSRYNKDNKLKFKSELMYEMWMKKSLKGELASEVFTHQNENIINGMVTVKNFLKDLEIGLIAVNDNVQSKGIGSQLIKFVENWAFSKNLENIFVTTQKENYAACQFYEKNKFIISDTNYIYHFWK